MVFSAAYICFRANLNENVGCHPYALQVKIIMQIVLSDGVFGRKTAEIYRNVLHTKLIKHIAHAPDSLYFSQNEKLKKVYT